MPSFKASGLLISRVITGATTPVRQGKQPMSKGLRLGLGLGNGEQRAGEQPPQGSTRVWRLV